MEKLKSPETIGDSKVRRFISAHLQTWMLGEGQYSVGQEAVRGDCWEEVGQSGWALVSTEALQTAVPAGVQLLVLYVHMYCTLLWTVIHLCAVIQ